jgi:cystathionine beta-lyase/cystathionine gamma-synthase
MDQPLDYIINHAGETRSAYLNSGSPPVFLTSLFSFPNLEAMQMALQKESTQPFYTRGTNPNLQMLETKLAALEKGEACLLFASGSAAIAAAVCSQVKAGDHVVCVQKPYSWTGKLLRIWLAKFGVDVSFVEGDLPSVQSAIQGRTKVIYLETPNSFTFEIQDIGEITSLAKSFGIKTIVDNSYSTPIFQNPIVLGADMVVHSASKYLSGHSDVVGGVLVCSNEDRERIFSGEYMTLGGTMSPMNAWLILRGLRTLQLRVKKSDENGMKISGFLASHPAVEKVYYPFLPSHPGHEIAKKQMSGCGGLMSIELKTKELEKISAFTNSLKYFLLACSWGSYESLCFPAAAMVSSSNYHSGPFPPNLVRLYCGLDEAEHLQDDLENALFLSGI